MVQQVKIDPEAVRALAELLRETDLTEIEYQIDSLRIKVLRSVPQAIVPVSVPQQQAASVTVAAAPGVAELAGNNNAAATASSAGLTEAANLENHPGVIEAQMVGTVYLSPGPEAEPFVSVGDTVSQGQTLFIIEAMKVMNMIRAPRSGTIKHIFVKDAQPVEYGDPIVILD